MKKLVKQSQIKICKALSDLNETSAKMNPWSAQKEENGGGVAAIFSKGKILEKGGVNVSMISGDVFPDMLKMLIPEEAANPQGLTFSACGISIVLHPYNPMIPTIHANYRYFEIEREKKIVTWFFGGGTDLTPYYLFEEDAIHFHQTLKNACDRGDSSLYPIMKKEADKYFYLPHRQEHRGIGGIFTFRINSLASEVLASWAENCAKAFTLAYFPIVEKRKNVPFSKKQKNWQLIRRGRYVEFNLLHDLGTSFGLKLAPSLAGAEIQKNIRNILMSLPPHVNWEYDDCKIKKGSEEAKLMEVIKNPRDWI